jgi:hypothetical protein
MKKRKRSKWKGDHNVASQDFLDQTVSQMILAIALSKQIITKNDSPDTWTTI